MKENDIDWDEFWEGQYAAEELLNDIREKACALDKTSFGALCCTLIDEYCEVNLLNPIIVSQWLAENVRIMNEKRGNPDVFLF